MNRKHSIGVSTGTESISTVAHKRTFSESSDQHQDSIVTKVVTKVSDLIPNWLKRNRITDESNQNQNPTNSLQNDTDSDDELSDNLAISSQPPNKRIKYPSLNGGYSVPKVTVPLAESTINDAQILTNPSATQTTPKPHCSSDLESCPSSSTGSVSGKRNLYLSKGDEQNRSIFNQSQTRTIISKSNTSNSSPNRDPSFNSSVFCSTRLSLNKTPLSSPFHKGALTYGGASAYQQLDRQYNIPENRSLSEFETTPKRFKVSINPSVNSPLNATNSRRGTTHLSNTAKQILSTLEQFATPIKWAQDTGELMESNYNERLKSQGIEPYNKPDHVNKIKEISGNKKPNLEIPIVSEFLQMKLKQHMQNNTENIRKIATGSKSKLNIDQYQLPKPNNEVSESKFTLKIKNKVTVKSRQTTSNSRLLADEETNQPPTPPSLPNVPLPITTLPQFDLSSNAKKPSINDSGKSNESFKFSSPIVLTNDDQVATSVSNFEFSVPKSVVDDELASKEDTKNCSDVRNNGMILANEINTWECDLCLIKNVNNLSNVCIICKTKRKLSLIGKQQSPESNYNMFTCVICASKVTSENNTEKKCFRCKIKEEQLKKPKVSVLSDPLEQSKPVQLPAPRKSVQFLDINKLFDKNKVYNPPKLYITLDDVTDTSEKKTEKNACDSNDEVVVIKEKMSDNHEKVEEIVTTKVNDEAKSVFRFGSVPITTNVNQVETVMISSIPSTAITSLPSLVSFSVPKPATVSVIDSTPAKVPIINTLSSTTAVSSTLTESSTTVTSTTGFTFGNLSSYEKSPLPALPLATTTTSITTTTLVTSTTAQVTLVPSTSISSTPTVAPIFKFGSSVSPTMTTMATTTSTSLAPTPFLFGNNITASQSITTVTTSISSPAVTTTQSSFSLFASGTNNVTTTTTVVSSSPFVFSASPKKLNDTVKVAETLSPKSFNFGSKLFESNNDSSSTTDTIGKSQTLLLKRSLLNENDTVKCVFGNNVGTVSSTTSPATTTTTTTGFGSFSNSNQFPQTTPTSSSLPTFGSLQGFGAKFNFGSSEKTMTGENPSATLKASSFNFGSSPFSASGTAENITQPTNLFQMKTNATTNTEQQKSGAVPVVFGSSPNSSIAPAQSSGFNFGFGSSDKSNLAQSVFGTATSNTQQSYFNAGIANTNTMVNGGFNIPTTSVTSSTPSSVFTFGSNQQSSSGFAFNIPNQTNSLPSSNFTFQASAQPVGTPSQTPMFNFSATSNSQPNSQLIQQRRILKANRRNKPR